MTPPARAALQSPRRPAPAPARPRHLEVVRGRPSPGRRPPTSFIVLAVLMTGTALFALVMANVLLGQAGFAQVDLQHRVAQKQSVVEQLELDVDHLRAPSRIGAAALRLGMVPPTDVTVVTSGSTSPVGGPPQKRERP